MKVFVSACILLSITIIGVFVDMHFISKTLYSMTDILDRTSIEEVSEDFENDRALLLAFREEWEDHLTLFYMSVDHSYITAVDENFATTLGACEAKDKALMHAGCLRLKNAVENLHNLIRFNLNSTI